MSFQVPNRIDSNLDEVLNVELPISERKSFSPAKVAQNVPQLRALLMMRKLLVEAMSNIDNRRALRRLIQETYQSPEALQAARAVQDRPTAIVANTKKGFGILPVLEPTGDLNYHGKPLSKELAEKALALLAQDK